MMNPHSKRRTINQGHLASLHRGVTSIEYALVASLIFLVAFVAFVAAGDANGAFWTSWTGKAVAALGR